MGLGPERQENISRQALWVEAARAQPGSATAPTEAPARHVRSCCPRLSPSRVLESRLRAQSVGADGGTPHRGHRNHPKPPVGKPGEGSSEV